MIDIHCHILPEMDDGAKSLSNSLHMCRHAMADGITTIIASPHHLNGQYWNERSDVLKKVNLLQEELDALRFPLEILPGSEVYMDADLLMELQRGSVTSLNDEDKYLLLELPRFFNIDVIKKQLFEVKVKGFVPILSHPERSPAIMDDIELLYELIMASALTQITSSSIMGVFGKKIEKTAKNILVRGMGHFVASDAHNTSNRTPTLLDSYEETRKLIGDEEAFHIFHKNPEALLEGEDIVFTLPERPKKGFFASLFRR